MRFLRDWVFQIGVYSDLPSYIQLRTKKLNQIGFLTISFAFIVLLSILFQPTDLSIKWTSFGLFVAYLLPYLFNKIRWYEWSIFYFILLVNATNGVSSYLYGTDANYQVYYIPTAFVLILVLNDLSKILRASILIFPLIMLYLIYYQFPHDGKLNIPHQEQNSIATANLVACLIISFFVSYFYVHEFKRNIEARGISEREKEKTVELFHVVFDKIPMDIALFDPEGRFLYLSKHGIKDDELRKWIIGKKNIDYFIYRNSQLELGRGREEKFLQTVQTQKTVEYFEDFISRTGEKKVLWRNYVPIVEDGNLKYVVGFGTDISQIKATEQKLSEQNEELKSLNEELDRMVYGASHDLRAPIATVMGLIELSQREENLEPIREYMGMMSISLQKLERFIQDLTNYSRNRRLALELETIHVKELAENTLKLVAPLNASDFKLQLIDLQEVPLISDRRRLDIVFNNLISNAIKYRNQDPNIESQLTITWKVSPEEAILIFSDNGKGIADKHVHKVFQMFYRAHPELPGTGIGLFIVAETIRFLGGTITVDSEENVGTTFTISLPNHSKSRTED